jgi:hypothetical protein
MTSTSTTGIECPEVPFQEVINCPWSSTESPLHCSTVLLRNARSKNALASAQYQYQELLVVVLLLLLHYRQNATGIVFLPWPLVGLVF